MLLAFVYLKDTQKVLKYSNDTWGEFKGRLDFPRALHVQLDTQGIWALEALEHSKGNWGSWTIRYSKGTWGTWVIFLADSLYCNYVYFYCYQMNNV